MIFLKLLNEKIRTSFPKMYTQNNIFVHTNFFFRGAPPPGTPYEIKNISQNGGSLLTTARPLKPANAAFQ